ncbi:unnamed protein product [Parnassius mnemosyne]|uniref:Kazal-like domain-containing protein n=1 Tax=Parnassius mnemosyne TaxID=213953 RepID=A0AAV1KH47_9NEOP
MILYFIFFLLYSKVTALKCRTWTQVCGTDGKTYPTACHLNKASIEDWDLQILHEGPCFSSLRQIKDNAIENINQDFNDELQRSEDDINDSRHLETNKTIGY